MSRAADPLAAPPAKEMPKEATAVGRSGAPAFVMASNHFSLASTLTQAAVGEPAAHLGIVEPHRQMREVLAPQHPEGRALAGENEVPFAHGVNSATGHTLGPDA